MEKTNGNIKLFMVNNKLLPNTSVAIGFKCQCNWFVLQKLILGQPCSCIDLAYASENTCVAFSIYETIKEKLMGSPLEQSLSKVSSMLCNYQNDEFVITFNCQNNISTVKKNLISVISKITPSKYYSKYSNNIKLLNGNPFKSEFIYSVNQLKNMTLNIFIIGKLNVSDEKMSDIAKKLNEKFIPIIEMGAGEKPASLNKQIGQTLYPTTISDGYNAVFVRDFIRSETGFSTVVNSGSVIIYNKKWNIASKRIDESHIKKYVDTKYGKLKDKFIHMSLYMIASECSLDILNMIRLYKDNPLTSSIVNSIKKCM